MTKKRILFVDDEPLVLEALQRALRGQRHQWDLEFVESAAQALDRLAQAPFDVIVSDMRMPGMNGAQLLGEVMQRHPKTVRIVLSGHADKDLIVQCVGSTHQYLSKPCRSEELIAAVQRATSLDYLQQHERLRAMVGRMDHLPTVPALYTALIEALQSTETSAEDIGKLIARDIGMTARMLKIVNSAFFGLARPLTDPVEAVNHLGFDTVKSLVLAIGAFGQLQAQTSSFSRVDEIWTHSVAVSMYTKLIAREAGADRKTQEDAYVSGLLHDVGKLVLLVNSPEDTRRMLDLAKAKKLRDCEAEREIFGADHAEVGGYLLSLWGLPAPVVQAVALHHQPRLGASAGFTPLTSVHVGNALVHGAGASGVGDANKLLDADYLTGTGLFDQLDVWISAWQRSAVSPPSL